MKLNPSFSTRAVALAAGALLSFNATAALFEDTDARRAEAGQRRLVQEQRPLFRGQVHCQRLQVGADVEIVVWIARPHENVVVADDPHLRACER